jgi:outer membrane lipoprotein-sorting protein
MWKIILLSTVQCLFLSGGQVFLKVAMNHTGKFRLSWEFFRGLLTNGYLAASGLCMVAATLLWLYIIKHFDFSVAYPMISISYIFGILAAIYIFHETVPWVRWAGVFLIMAGVTLIAQAQQVKQVKPDEEREVEAQIEKASRNMTSLVCRFEQVKTLSVLNEEMVSQGRLYYRNDRRLRWEYLSPYAYTFVLNGQTVLMQAENSRNVVDVKASGFFREIVRIMMNGISGSGLTDGKSFDVRYCKSPREGLWEAQLVPRQKDMKQLFASIILTFNAEDYTVEQVLMNERSGDATRIRLYGKQLNAPIEDDTFHID